MAGMLPEMKFASVQPALQAFRSGVEDSRADQEFAQNQERRNLLKQVGQTAARDGLAAAGNQALAGGDVATGIKLQDLSLDRQAKLFDFMGRGAQAADTPEKWQAFIGTIGKTFGADSVKGFEDFRARESAIMLALNAKEQADLAIRRQQLGLQERQVNVAEAGLRPKAANEKVKDAQGNETIVRIEPDGSTRTIYGGEPSAPTNPYAAGGKFNEGQGKAATYADRMNESHKTITDLEDINDGVTGFIGGVASNRPAVRDSSAFNKMASPDRQKVLQAQRNFINATLRRESGAVINPDEFANARQQYFPQPGDSKEVIEQKRQNRITTMQGFMREAGPSYKAPEIARGPTPKTKLPKGVSMGAALSQAKAAIAQGKDKTAIINRLKQWGVDTSGL